MPGFASGRDLSAWLGLVPKQMSTGDRTILGRISKRGNKYVRTLLVQAAHIILVRQPQTTQLGLWPCIETASKRLHRNTLVIALANKLARIAWAVLARDVNYQPKQLGRGWPKDWWVVRASDPERIVAKARSQVTIKRLAFLNGTSPWVDIGALADDVKLLLKFAGTCSK